MKSYNNRTTAKQYKNLLTRILDEGEEVGSWQEKNLRKQGKDKKADSARSLRVRGHQMRFPMKEGFPVITERDMSGSLFTGALAEHIAFLNGARTHEELKKFGCNWWNRWVTEEKCSAFGLEEGDLGPGSYGPTWTAFPTAEGYSINQIENVIRQIKRAPFSRTHVISNWIPQYAVAGEKNDRRVVVAPCHGFLHIFVNPEKNVLDVHHFQRSADVPVGLAFNIIQYAAFGLMLEHITGYTFRDLIYTISDAHIYRGQIPDVKEMLEEPDRPFPTVSLDTRTISKITEFRPEHFTLEDDYESGPRKRIWTPV